MRALLFATTLFTGCTSYEDRSLPAAQPEGVTAVVSRTLHGDTRCPEHTRSAVGAAMGTYANVTDGRAQLRVAWDVDDTSLMTLAPGPVILCTDLPPRWGDHVDGDIVRLALGVCPDEYACALHALGHYLGMVHLPHGHGVMAASNPSRMFSSGDIAELTRVGLYAPRRTKDVTTVTVTIDPAVPRVEPNYPQ